MASENRETVGEGDKTCLDPSTAARAEEIRRKLGGVRQLSHEWLHSGKWLKSSLVRYEGTDGKSRKWEAVERTTRKGPVDGTEVLMLTSNCEKICLVAVYRPPVDKVCLELPSGLMEPGESTEQAALRELEEETGYKGLVQSMSPELFIDPWKSNESSVVCTVSKVGGCADERRLDDDEFLETLEVPLANFKTQLELLQKKYGFAIDSRLYYFALGLEIAQKDLCKQK